MFEGVTCDFAQSLDMLVSGANTIQTCRAAAMAKQSANVGSCPMFVYTDEHASWGCLCCRGTITGVGDWDAYLTPTLFTSGDRCAGNGCSDFGPAWGEAALWTVSKTHAEFKLDSPLNVSGDFSPSYITIIF